MSSSVRARGIFANTLGPITSNYTSRQKPLSESTEIDQCFTSAHVLKGLIKSEDDKSECLRREESCQIHAFKIDKTSSESSLQSIQSIYSDTHERLRQILMDSRLIDQAQHRIHFITRSMIEELASSKITYEEKRSSAERSQLCIMGLGRRLQVLRCRSHAVEQELLSGKRRLDLVHDSYDQIILVLENLKSRHVDSLQRLRTVIINHRSLVDKTAALQHRARTLTDEVESGVEELRKFKESYVGKLFQYRTLEEALSRSITGMEDLSKKIVEIGNRNYVLIKSSDDVKCKFDKFGQILDDFRKPMVVCSANPDNTALNSSYEWSALLSRSTHKREQQHVLRNQLARSKRLTPGKIIQISSEKSKTEYSYFELQWMDRVRCSQSGDPPLPCVVEIISELLKHLRNIRDSVKSGTCTNSGGQGHYLNSESGIASHCLSYPDHRSVVLEKSLVEAQIRLGFSSLEEKVTIKLSGLGLCGIDIPIIIDVLQRLNCLERISVLDLSGNSLVDSDTNLLRKLIDLLPEMVCLDISSNGFTDAAKNLLESRTS